MKPSLKLLSPLLNAKDLDARLNGVLVQGGFAYATDGRSIACAPFPYAGTFLVHGANFEKLVNRLPDGAAIEQRENDIVVKHGRMRGTLPTMPIESMLYPPPEGKWLKVPKTLAKAFSIIRPFISDNAIHPWALCACSVEDGLIATNNITLVKAAVKGFKPPEGLLLPYWTIDYVLDRPDNPAEYVFNENHIAFRWPDGAWFKSQLMAGKFPEAAATMLDSVPAATVELTKEWKQAYEFVRDMIGQARITVTAEGVSGGTAHADAPLPALGDAVTMWGTQFLDNVVALATHWEPTLYPAPASFRGDGFVGLIVGMK